MLMKSQQKLKMYQKILIVVIILYISISATLSSEMKISSQKILEFCQSNDWKYLTVVAKHKNSLQKEHNIFLTDLIQKAKEASFLRSRRIELQANAFKNNNSDSTYDLKMDSLIVLSSSDERELKMFLNMISKTKIKKALLVFLNALNQNEIVELKNLVSRLSENMYFYLYYSTIDAGSYKSMWERIITIRHNPQVIMNQLEFSSFGRIKPSYDLQGIHIKCSTLSWAPYLSLFDCNENDGKSCKSEGYLADLVDMMGSQQNFTWHCDAEPNNDWGTAPKSGPANVNGSWGGVLGDVTNGDYPLCLSSWTNTYSRVGMVDFVVAGEGSVHVMALYPQYPKYDTGLFTRPLTKNVWIVIGVISFVILFCLIIINVFSKEDYMETSLRIVTSIGWLTFFLVMVHFEGALTMFFTTEISVPFESRTEGMKAYPEWKTMIRKGNDRMFRELSEQGIPIYIDYWDRMQNDPTTVFYKNIKDGVQLMKDGQVIIHINEKSLRQYFKKNPTETRPKTFQSEGENLKIENMIVTDNSPLGPILSHSSQLLRESGIMATLQTKWMGQKFTSGMSTGAESHTLQPGQVMMSFSILCGSICVSLLFVGIEYLMMKSPNKEN